MGMGCSGHWWVGERVYFPSDRFLGGMGLNTMHVDLR